MGKITVIGLGLEKGDITLSALNVINSGVKLIARTNLAVSYNQIKELVGEIPSLDFVYQKSRNFGGRSRNENASYFKMCSQGNASHRRQACYAVSC